MTPNLDDCSYCILPAIDTPPVDDLCLNCREKIGWEDTSEDAPRPESLLTDEQRARALPQPEGDEGLVKRLLAASDLSDMPTPGRGKDDQAAIRLKPIIQRYADLCREAAQALTAKEARIAELESALVWCSGSADFQEGGRARVGWLKLCQPLLDTLTPKEQESETGAELVEVPPTPNANGACA